MTQDNTVWVEPFLWQDSDKIKPQADICTQCTKSVLYSYLAQSFPGTVRDAAEDTYVCPLEGWSSFKAEILEVVFTEDQLDTSPVLGLLYPLLHLICTTSPVGDNPLGDISRNEGVILPILQVSREWLSGRRFLSHQLWPLRTRNSARPISRSTSLTQSRTQYSHIIFFPLIFSMRTHTHENPSCLTAKYRTDCWLQCLF